MPQSKAIEIRCERCGAAFELAALAETVQCPSCDHRQVVDFATLESAWRYQMLPARTAEAMTQVHVGHQMTDPSAMLKANAIFALFFAPVALLVALVALGVIQLDPRTAHISILISFALAYGGGTLVYHVLRWRKVRLPSTTVTCPGCGARSKLTPGQSHGTCAHCGATLLPSPELVAADVRSATRMVRQAKLRLQRRRPNPTVAALSTPEESRRLQRLQGMVEQLVTKHHAEPLDPADILLWLQAFWEAPYSPHVYFTSAAGRVAATLTLDDYPMLVDAATGTSDEDPGWLTLTLSHDPLVPDRQHPDVMRQSEERLAALGFRLSLDQTGILADATRQTLHRLHHQSETFDLTDVIGWMHHLAQARGGKRR